MQIKNWTDLRFLLAIQRMQTLAKTAKLLGVDATTVSRKLERLEKDVGAQLMIRASDATYTLTEAGQAVAKEAEVVAQRIDVIENQSRKSEGKIYGTVRLTSVPIIINRLLVPVLQPFLKANPELNVELIAESRDYSLTRREADLAIRLSRPVQGGSLIKARRIADWNYLLYAAADLAASEDQELPMILYDDALAHLPQAQWIMRAARSHKGGVLPLRMHDAETALEAASAGIGLAILPETIASRMPRLRRSDLVTGNSDLV